MLTKKELLKYKKQKEKLLPCFIDPLNPILIEFNETLFEIFSQCLGKTRKEIECETDDMMNAFDVNAVVALGLKKLYFDTLTFESELSAQTTEFRESVFKESFLNLSQSPDNYKDLVVQSLNENNPGLNPYTKENIANYLYSDLPEFHKVTEIKPLMSNQILNKYNVSLVQGFLFYCREIKIILPSVSEYKAQFRQLLRQFEKKENAFELVIDGPLSLFAQTQKYGFQLACFFPALLLMPQWELCAQIELGKELRQSGVLSLSHKTGLISHYKNYSAFIPEEFKLFSESFLQHKNAQSWILNDNCDEALFDGDNYFFPDFEFHSSKKEKEKNSKVRQPVYLELFHPWHGAALKHRLIALAKKKPSYKLILGVSTALLKKADISSFVQHNPYFVDFGFTFRDVVSVDKVIAKL